MSVFKVSNLYWNYIGKWKTRRETLTTHQLPLGLARGVCDGDQQSVDHLHRPFIVHERRFVVPHQCHFPGQLRVLAYFSNRNCHYCHSRCVHVTIPPWKFYGSSTKPLNLPWDIHTRSQCTTSHFYNLIFQTSIVFWRYSHYNLQLYVFVIDLFSHGCF